MNIIERAFRYSFVRMHVSYLLLILLLLVLPSMWAGYHSDDYFHLLLLQGKSILPRGGNGSLWGLFSFIDSTPESRQQMLQYGVLPWFAADDFYFRFWRPVTEITHWLDVVIFGVKPFPAHLHSLLWFVLILVPFYRLVEVTFPHKPKLALLACIIFALDGQHVATIGWIANRSALLATFFSLSTLFLHIKWRNTGRISNLVLACICFILALASAEMAVGIFAYLIMYAWMIEAKGKWLGVASMIPYAIILAVWMYGYHYFGYGSSASAGLYINPWLNPQDFVMALAQRIPVYFAAGLLSFPAGASWVLASWGAYLPLIILSCSIVILLVFFVYFRLWIDENKSVRFWLYASLLSLIPVCSTMAQDRLAILQTVGMDIVIAGLLYYAFFQASQLSLYRRYFAILLVVCHLLLSPLHLVLGSAYLHWAAAHIEKNALSIRGEMEGKLMVVMQAPIGEVVTFAGLRQVHGKDIPKQILWLSNDEGRLQVQIESGRSLLVEKKPGFATGFESAFRSAKAESLDTGKRIQVGDVSIYPLRKNMQGYVDKIRVIFSQEVSSGHILFYRLDNDGYHPLTLAELALVYAAN